MSLRNSCPTPERRPEHLDLAMTVEAVRVPWYTKDFREFTAPMRQQRGGAIRWPHKGDRLRRIRDYPDLGGNVP